MYGTIARMKVKPGAMDALRQEANTAAEATGPGAYCVFQMDADPNEIYAVAIAESEQAYRAMSESPEQHAEYLERLKWLEAEPEWHDGQVIQARQHDAPEGANLYGSIAEVCLKPGALEALMDNGNGSEPPEGSLALYVFQMDADPNNLFMVAISESEQAYRAYSESPESHQRYSEMRKWLQAEPKWHDGHVISYQRSNP